MKQLGKVLNKTSWAQASNTINTNSESVFSAVTMLENAAFKHKGYFLTSEEVEQLYPSAEEGSQAFVYDPSNPSTAPYDIYQVVGGTWADTGLNGGSVSVDLTKKQDTLVGYSESVSGGKATQVAIQGDTIALSGKVSLGNVDNMESAILMSSSLAGAAVAKANTVEQSMNALKSPVKPLHLNSQGKLKLNIGKGLYVEDGKLCTTGASGGGGGGTTLSEGDGIRIYNDTINVAYDIDTLRVNSCGGLTVNYGEGLTIKNGKLSAQASVNAGNGLVKKGDALQVSVGTGLLVADDVYVNMGKGLATDNENKVNVNLDEQTLTTDACGKVIVDKDSLIGNGLKQEYSKLAVNYGTGLALSNKAIVVNYGTGLSIQDGKLVSTAQGGKTYVGGQAVNITGNEINVKYDGVTISTKDSPDNSLHVMLGSGLIQGTSGIDVAVGSGLAIGSDNKLYSTVSSGATYSAGDGISISGGKISFNLGTSLESKCGYIQVAISSGLEYDENNEARIRVKAGKGITIPNTGEVRAHLSNGLAFDNYGAIKICDAVLTDISNLKDSKQDKLTFGSGLTKSGSTVVLANNVVTDISNNKSNISALQTTVANIPTYSAGDGISISGGKIAVKYCDGLQITNGSLAIATGDGLHIKDNKLAINPSDGLGFTIDGVLKLKLHEKSGLQTTSAGLGVNAGVAIGTSDGKLNVQYGTGLKVVNNKLDVDTSKIAGVGIDLDSDYKMLTIGTKAAQELAGTGLVADGPKIKVKYGSGLTTNTCGGLIVDAGKLTVGNATNATYLDGLHAAYYTPRDRSVNGKDMNAQKESAIYMGYNMENSAVTEISSFLVCRYSDDWGAQMQFSLVSGKAYVRFWQNAGGIMGTWKELAYKDGTVARATADANGNKITETYARRFMPTYGLEINSDRELFLPNLTASVINGAADGSKNGAQRVLNLSCGAIQIKLSTGLAIDEEGYLYIQDK